MKLKQTIILSFVILISCNEIDNEVIKLNLKDSIEIYNGAMSNMDGDIIISFYPSVLSSTDENKTKILKGILSQKEQMFDNGITIGKIETSDPIKFKRIGNEVHGILEQNIRVHTPVTNLATKSFLYALSQNYGKDWIIMDFDFIARTFPDFQYEFKINNEYSSKEDSCKHYSSSLFASKICVDRYVESGEYVVSDKYDIYSTLKRANQESTLNEIELELIEESIDKWEKEANVKCIFPSITNESIKYIGNSIGRFFMHDVYGIPFEWKRKGDSKYHKDTLPGSFKHHTILASENFKNSQKIDSIENSFDIYYDTEYFE